MGNLSITKTIKRDIAGVVHTVRAVITCHYINTCIVTVDGIVPPI